MSGLPESWIQTTLGEVIIYADNKTTDPDSLPNDAWLVELEDIERDTSKLLSRKTVAERSPKSSKNRFDAGDVLYGKLRPYLNKVVRADQSGYCSSEIIAISPGLIDKDYLFYSMRSPSFLQYVSGVSHGVRMPRLGTQQANGAPFVLPPVAEQTRIAAKLDELLAQVDTLKARINGIPALLKRFRQSVLAAAVSGRLTEEWRQKNSDKTTESLLENYKPLPRPARWKSRSDTFIAGNYAIAVGKPASSEVAGWSWIPLVDVAKMESGHTPSRSKAGYWGGDVCWIGIRDANLNHSKTIWETEQKTNELGLANSASRLLPAGTVCISRTASVGYVVQMGKEMATSQDFVNWVPTDPVCSDWLKWLFVAERESLYKFGKGSTHTTVYFPEWLSMHVLLPHIDEQKEIVRRVEQLFAFADQLEARIKAAQTRIDRLTHSILAKAFRGELVPQDPNDEPASLLLERVKAQRAAAPKVKRGRKSQA